MATDEREVAAEPEDGAGPDAGRARVRGEERRDRRHGVGQGLVKGLGVTLKHLVQPAVTQQYPKERPQLPARSRGVIALVEENCTVCYKCSRACPDWCIYIDAHKETHEPAAGGRGRSVKVLDRFAIDYALCMYCGICVEVCPFDALLWSPEFEYATFDLVELVHEKDRLQEWNRTVPPPPEAERGAEVPAPARAAAAPAAPAAVRATPAAPAAPPAAAAAAPPAAAGPAAPAGEAPAPPRPRAPRVQVEPDQATYERVLAEQLEKGSPQRMAEARAKAAAIKAAREKAAG